MPAGHTSRHRNREKGDRGEDAKARAARACDCNSARCRADAGGGPATRAQGSELDGARLPISYRRGDVGAAHQLPHDRRALGRACPDPAWHDRLRGQHAVACLRRRAVRARPAARCVEVFHRAPRCHRPRQVGQAVRWAARQVSPLQLRRHGVRPAPARDRGSRPAPRAADPRQLDGGHAHLDLGRHPSRISWMCWRRWQRSRPRCRAATG